MKALSLTQPWATLVAIGAKRIETRSWPTKYRGDLAIHASKGFPADCRDLCYIEPFFEAMHGRGFFPPALQAGEVPRVNLPLGAIVAVARLVEVCYTGDALNHRDFRFARHLGDKWPLTDTEREFGSFSGGRFAWLLDDVRRLPVPIPCRGALGLWNVPAALYRGLHEA